MAKKDKEFRLCYVRDNIMYFTDNFENQVGDDWNDTPYDCNAGEPYEWNDKEDAEWNKHHGHLRYIGFYSWYTSVMVTGCLGAPYNVPYSVDAINNRAIPWLYTDEAGGLMAGATMDEAVAWCRKSKVKFGELTE